MNWIRQLQARQLAKQLKERLAGMPADPADSGAPDRVPTCDALREHRAHPYVLPDLTPSENTPLRSAKPPSAPQGGDRIQYSLSFPPEMEEWYRTEATLELNTFSRRLVRLVEQRCRKPADFYKAAGIDRKLFSAISRDPYHQPSRATAIRCCLALRLPFSEASELLASAGYVLSDARRTDLVVRACIEKGIYDISDVNAVLYAVGEKTLG